MKIGEAEKSAENDFVLPAAYPPPAPLVPSRRPRCLPGRFVKWLGTAAIALTIGLAVWPLPSHYSPSSLVQKIAMDDRQDRGTAVGLDTHVTSSGTPATGVEINHTGSGVGADVNVSVPPGTSAVGVRSVVSGPGTGLRVIQNGPGTGLSVNVRVGN